jgi:hypothetical protein
MRFLLSFVTGVLLTLPSQLSADLRFDQTTKVTGGVIASWPRYTEKPAFEIPTATVAIKGSRLVHRWGSKASIFDLDKETLTEIDFAKKRYSVTTFQQWKEARERPKADVQRGVSFVPSENRAGLSTPVENSPNRRSKIPQPPASGG